MKAYSYARVSSTGQAAEGRDGYTRQREAIASYAASRSIEIAGEFEDAISGVKEWKDRPGLLAMLDAIFSNGVRTIIVERPDRLARSVVVQENAILYLASKGINIICAETGEDLTEAMTSEPLKKAIVQMQAIFAELEKNSLVRKLRAARRRKREATGRCEGQKPFGEKPGELLVLNRIRSLRRNGAGAVRIAAQLNREGHMTRKGGRWSPGTVAGILKREAA